MNDEMKKLKDNQGKKKPVDIIEAILLIAIGFTLAMWVFGNEILN